MTTRVVSGIETSEECVMLSYCVKASPVYGRLCGVLQMKCQRYWPEVQKEMEFGPFLVVTVSEETKPHYILRELLIQKAAPEVFEGEDGVEEGYEELVSASRRWSRGGGVWQMVSTGSCTYVPPL